MQTLGDVVRAIFPLGTAVLNGTNRLQTNPNYQECPIFPPDVFAVVGKLIELSGAYHHVTPEISGVPAGPAGRLVRITAKDVEWAESQAKLWRRNKSDTPVPSKVQAEWSALIKCVSDQLFQMLHIDSRSPNWWKPAVRLMMVSDQASVGIGFDLSRMPVEGNAERAVSWVDLLWRDLAPPRDLVASSGGLHHARARGIFSYSSADPNIVCVLPKVRTAGVGCSLRSLTHNLALLPPQGVTRVWWLEPTELCEAKRRPLNIVLIPFPYQMSATCFKQGAAKEEHGWGWFELQQRWLEPEDVDLEVASSELVEFVIALVEGAAADVGEVHGVVMPELSITYRLFTAICDAIEKSSVKASIEFFICGTSDNASRIGNFACTATFGREALSSGETRTYHLKDDRQKHHRWRLDRYQITRYGLTSALDPHLLWWEDLPIMSRSISMQQIRSGSVLTSMICEDLARVDPCQEALRSIGPNLVFALLMDGPQLKSRWPGRYATVLAEDPGCSVLTLSSFGLIARANESGGDTPSRVIALWKDLDIDRREIQLDPDALAVCLTLNVRDQEEFTLDGRSDGRAAPVWTLGAVKQVRKSTLDGVPAWIECCP